ncbi:hypothetical protein PRIPAC_97444, partial [Pristionchus pacificus]
QREGRSWIKEKISRISSVIMDDHLQFAFRDDEENEKRIEMEETKMRYGGAQADSDDEEEDEEEVEEVEEEEEEEAEEEEEEKPATAVERTPSPVVRKMTVAEEEEAKKAAERERKKAEVRKRLEEAGRAKKAKKGFLTPERKKKLRKLLMLKAAEDLKQKQRQLELERQRVLAERILPLPDLDRSNLKEIFEEFKKRVIALESDCYDINYLVRQKDFEINELTIAVNDLRGKFVKPTLKKVSKTEGKFSKLTKKAEPRVDFRSGLKTVERNHMAGLEKDDEPKKWSK